MMNQQHSDTATSTDTDTDTVIENSPTNPSRFHRMMNAIHKQSVVTLVLFFALAMGFAMQFNSEQVIAEHSVRQYALFSALDFMSTEFIIFYSALSLTAIILFKSLRR
jgi:hypothetical protein